MGVRIEPGAEPIPGYRLIDRLGGGGFGEVWKAEAPGGLLKAIKFVFGDLKAAGDQNQRAEQELKAMARVKTVRHPYVLSLERYDIIDGQLIIVMELADRNLWDRFKECRSQGLEGIPRGELLRYMEESAEALDLMNHQYQLQHLDIKPQNIFLIGEHIKVADFGLAKDLEGSVASVTGGVTPVYAAPETFEGTVSRFCDQYSLAILYQELLTGRRPFNGSNVRQLILQHLQAVPDVSPLPPGDQPVIARALSKAYKERYPSCLDMVRPLRQNTLLPGSGPSSLTETPVGVNGQATPTVCDPDHKLYSPPETREAEAAPAGSHATASLDAPGAGTGSDQKVTRLLRNLTSSQPGEKAGKEPFKEVKSDGALFPALILAVGQTGQTVLQRLREILVERFESLSRLPHLRMLLLDTDPEAARQATRCGPGDCHAIASRAALGTGEVLLAGLNRPSYYLKPRDGKLAVDAWMNPRMLYRIPRSQVTTGVRALGRLAFCDNYRAIQRRLHTELDACLDTKPLLAAAQQTGLGLRTNRPRVYILCGLAGGTGSGMFLDLAYTVRAQLKKLGFEQPDVVGLLLLPALESHQTRVMALGNAYAALNELNHFGKPGSHFRAQYLERETSLEDIDPPFSRYFLLPLPDECDEVANRELADLAGQFLYRDLCTPLGQAVDLARAGLPAPPWLSRGQFYQTFGLHPVSWPKHALCRRVGRYLCQKLVQRWLSKDSKPLREPVQEWVTQQWSRLELGGEHFISRLRDRCQEALGPPPETVLAGLIEPLTRKATLSPATMRRGASAVELAPEEIKEVLDLVEEWLGKPSEGCPAGGPAPLCLPGEMAPAPPGRILQMLKELAETLTAEVTQKLAELSVRLIEEPAYRLAGAEEAVRQLIAQVEQVLQRYEPLSRELTTKTEESYVRLQILAAPIRPGQRRPAAPARDVVELLRLYLKNRLQSQLLLQVSSTFVSLRGHLSDEQREINFCRVRLTELLRHLESGEAGRELPPATGKQLFPAGCTSLGQAVEHLVATVTPELLLELDGRMEEMIKQKFTALVNICLTHGNILKNVEQEMLQTGQQFAAGMLPETDVARLFLEQAADLEQQVGAIGSFNDEAAPELTPARSLQPDTLTVLATPTGEAGDTFRQLVHATLPDVEVHPAPSSDDVVFYRETVNLPLAEVPHLGAPAQLAYRQMDATDNFTPHTRIDIEFR